MSAPSSVFERVLSLAVYAEEKELRDSLAGDERVLVGDLRKRRKREIK
jgi:hypothetical protein